MIKKYLIGISALLLIVNFGCKKNDSQKKTYDTGLAKLYINLEGGVKKDIITKDDYTSITANFYPAYSEDGDTLIELKGGIEGRGNSTWSFIKKPYKIKFDEKISLFGLPAEKKWVFLANYADKSLIRNYLAYRLAKRMESPYPPSAHFVDVYINGKYEGNYMLSDQIEVGKNRVNIEKLEAGDNDSISVTGGYLLEIDGRVPDKGKPYFTAQKYHIRFRAPKEPTEAQRTYITNYVEEAETVLFGNQFKDSVDGFRKYFDEESVIRWFWVSEVFKNPDSKDFSSIFFFKDRGGKLVFGPVWDFDLAAGNEMECGECLQPEGWYIKDSYWIGRMFEDESFKAKAVSYWHRYKGDIDELFPELEEIAGKLKYSAKENFRIWPDFSDPAWATVQGYHSHEEHLDYLKDWLQKRINWLNREVDKL